MLLIDYERCCDWLIEMVVHRPWLGKTVSNKRAWKATWSESQINLPTRLHKLLEVETPYQLLENVLNSESIILEFFLSSSSSSISNDKQTSEMDLRAISMWIVCACVRFRQPEIHLMWLTLGIIFIYIMVVQFIQKMSTRTNGMMHRKCEWNVERLGRKKTLEWKNHLISTIEICLPTWIPKIRYHRSFDARMQTTTNPFEFATFKA